MAIGFKIVDDVLQRSFYKLGVKVGKQPGYFIIVPVLVAIIFCTGYQQINYEIDPEYLFSPVRGEGKYERAVVEEFFKVNYSSRFNVGRITRPGRFGRVIVTVQGGGDMLQSIIWQELRQLDDYIQSIEAQYDDETFNYKDICAKWMGECFRNDILNLDKIIDKVVSGDMNLTWPIAINTETWDVHVFPVYFGGTQLSEDGTYVKSVPSLQLVYFVTADSKRQDARGAAWEDAFLDAIGNLSAKGMFPHLSVSMFASRTLDHELEKNTRTVVPYFTSTFVLMVLFSCATCMMSDSVRSKPWLGLCGNVSASMATAAAFGACIYVGIKFIGINLAAPFLMIGIGIDDTFVMLAAWRRTSPLESVPERMGQMMSKAAVSITITSLTDMISFWIGVLSPFPSVQIFCIYSGCAVFFTFVWHITFFAACVAIAGYCEQKNLHGLFCIPVQPLSKSGKRSYLYRLFCTGGIDHDNPENRTDNKEHMLMVFFRDRFAPFLNSWCVKLIVLTAFAAYLAGAGYGLTQIKEGLERRKIAREDSYSVEFFDREDMYFREFPYRIQVVIVGDHNYSDPSFQYEVENFVQTLENTSYVSNTLYTESWLRSFLGYMERNQDYLNVSIETEEEFIEALNEYWLFPSNPFSLDVKFNAAGDKIVASRFLIQAVNISDTNHEKEMVQALRDLCHQSSLNVTLFHPYFIFFDQFELVRPTSVQAMVAGAIVMMLISFIFIPNVLCSLWVAFSVISIEIGVAGYMALWDVNLDSISMINLIMCIGFSVDFTAHICHAYMSSEAATSEGKLRDCLYALGLPILQGALSTILGVLALILAGSYIFLVFFKMVFLVIFFGAMHGLFLLPVLLSLFGPGSCTPARRKDKLSLAAYVNSYYIPHPQVYHVNGKLEEKPASPSKELFAALPEAKFRQQEVARRGFEEWHRSLHSILSEPSQFDAAHVDKYNRKLVQLVQMQAAAAAAAAEDDDDAGSRRRLSSEMARAKPERLMRSSSYHGLSRAKHSPQ